MTAPTTHDTQAERWETAARDAVSEDLKMAADDVQAAMYDLADALWSGDDPTAAEVRDARNQLDVARTVLEDRAALVTPEADPWGRPPDAPMWALFEATNHPRAEGIDPWEYVDAEKPPEATEEAGSDE